jgi:hypothetical protein
MGCKMLGNAGLRQRHFCTIHNHIDSVANPADIQNSLGETPDILSDVVPSLSEYKHIMFCNTFGKTMYSVTVINFIQNYVQYPTLVVKSIRRRKCWGSFVYVSTYQINY